MKCDELKAEQWLDYSGEPMPCYPKAKVDAAIAELKQKSAQCNKKPREDEVSICRDCAVEMWTKEKETK